MKKHSGMRPHDVVILLKIASKGGQNWFMKDLANELEISASEISESINRSVLAGLLSSNKKSLNKLALLDFIKSGLRYVYPQQPGAMVRGIVTAHSAPPLSNQISSEELYVWPFAMGNVRGQAIEPLHPKIPEACLRDGKFYELIALADAIRVGKAREQKMGIEMIKERIENA
jgi:predicted transcriptional regulator